MSRRILVQTSVPAVVLGLTLFGACLAAVWSIGRLQANLSHITSQNVASLEAAQELVIQMRRVRVHALLYVADPSPARRELVEKDHQMFEAALVKARESASPARELRLVEQVEAGYRRYRAELDAGGTFAGKPWSREDFLAWADAHPVRHLAAPCRELLAINKEAMNEATEESATLGERARWGMLALGVVAPIGGLIAGVGIARGLSRSVARLEVHVQDVRAHLDREVASVRLPADGSLGRLEQQFAGVAARVGAVVEQVHRQQQEVLRAEQLAAVGRLAASVAHEVRNPLTAIKMLVGAALRGGELCGEDLRVIHGEVVRLEGTVQNLLDLARPPAHNRAAVDLRECVSAAVGVVRVRAAQQGVEVRVVQPNEPLVADVDAEQLRAALVNLLLNALDAMPRGGAIEVALEATAAGIRLAVRDTGPGIPAEILGRLFTPFVSGKPTGTGLGLSVCRRVAEQHGGGITGGNRPGGGAEFILTLPSPEDANADVTCRR